MEEYSSAYRDRHMLDKGTLYVAVFLEDGSGEWRALDIDDPAFQAAADAAGVSFESQADVLINTRLAADVVGATKMDRPEDVEPNLRNGRIYVACTNNTSRTSAQVDEANPRAANKDGHVVEMVPTGGDHTADTFGWNLFLICGDEASAGRYFGGWEGPVSPISCPDNVAFDSAGNLWVSTDGQPGAINLDDALFKVPVEGPERGHVQQFLAVPAGAETCGPVIRDREDSVFVAVQHPGEGGATAELPPITMSTPTKIKSRMIGVSHHFFLSLRKLNKSLTKSIIVSRSVCVSI